MEKIKIIAVDDELIILSILKMLLEHSDYDVTTCSSGKECLNLLEENEYDLALLDVFMPDMNGHELCKKIMEKHKDMMIIFLTGATGDDVLQKSFAVGGFDYIEKPVHKLELVSRVNNAMRVKRAEQKLQSTLQVLEEKNEILKKLVIIDGLTQLYNHKYIVEQLGKRFYEARRYRQDLCIIMFDIDFFKNVNDTCGHLFGDTVLFKLSACFLKNIRSVDFVGRYGGEEFLVVLPNTNLKNAVHVANFLREKVNEISFYEKPGFKITISGGVCEINGHNDYIEMISKADKNLYKAKENGRNRIES